MTVRNLVRLNKLRAPPFSGYGYTRLYRLGSALVDAAVGRRSARYRPVSAGRAWPAASRAAADDPAFELVLDLADAAGPNMLPFRT